MQRRGFTIIELIVVLAIMALVIGMSAPMFARFASGLRLNSASRQISTALHTARGYAITYRKNYSVVFDREKGKFWIGQDQEILDKVYDIPEAISIVSISFPDDRVTFKSTGSSDCKGTIVLGDSRGKEIHITVIEVTGGIKIN